MIGFAPDNTPSRNPPSPPFDKGGLGGFQRGVAQRKFSPQNIKSLHVSSTENPLLLSHKTKIYFAILFIFSVCLW
jgi:hypothetical protein